MSRKEGYMTPNLLDSLYHKKYYKFIGIDVSIHANTSIPQQINFVGKLEKGDDATMFFIAEKQQKKFKVFL